MPYQFDPQASRLLLHTHAKGMLAKLAHDLQISGQSLRATAEPSDGRIKVELFVPVRSLKVDGALKNGAVDKSVLSGSDKSDIERKIQSEVLRTSEVVIRASASEPTDTASDLTITGSVEVGGGRASFSSRTQPTVSGEVTKISGKTRVSMSQLGIPPVKGPLNAFRVDDEIDIVFDLAFRVVP